MIKENRKTNDNLKYFIFLHCVVFLNSFSGVCSKLASKESFFSVKFVLLYGIMIGILGIYAIAWQQIIKHIKLTTAFCNKSIGTIWTLTWAIVIFRETITWKMLLGTAIVVIGVIIVVLSDVEKNKVNT